MNKIDNLLHSFWKGLFDMAISDLKDCATHFCVQGVQIIDITTVQPHTSECSLSLESVEVT